MTTYVETALPAEDIEIFRRIRRIVEALPEIDSGIDGNGEKVLLSCHVLARAFQKLFPVLVCSNGHFSQNFEHSWLVTPNGNVIDVYPVGMIGGPVLVDRIVAGLDIPRDEPEIELPGGCRKPLYREARLEWRDFETRGFGEQVEKATNIVGETMKALEIDVSGTKYRLNYAVDGKGDSVTLVHDLNADDDAAAREESRLFIAEKQRGHNEGCRQRGENSYFWWKALSLDRVDGVEMVAREITTRLSS